MRADPLPARERGFTLLEVLIAFIIAALALGVMFDAALGGLRATDAASKYQEALSLARSHLASVTESVLASREVSGDDGHGFSYKLRIRPAGTVALARNPNELADASGPPPQATLYAVAVSVSWKSGKGEREVRLQSTRLAPGAARGG